jgi:hypothetical protein
MHLPTSLSIVPPVWLCEGLRRSKDYSTAAHRHAARILDLIQTDLLLQSCLDQRSGGHHRSPYVYKYSEVLPLRHRVIAPELSHHDLYDLEVGYIGVIINACAGA